MKKQTGLEDPGGWLRIFISSRTTMMIRSWQKVPWMINVVLSKADLIKDKDFKRDKTDTWMLKSGELGRTLIQARVNFEGRAKALMLKDGTDIRDADLGC